MCNIILNIIWLSIGDLFASIGRYLGGMPSFTIGLSRIRTCFKFAHRISGFCDYDMCERDSLGAGIRGLVGSILWFVFGISRGIFYLTSTLVLFMTIISIFLYEEILNLFKYHSFR